MVFEAVDAARLAAPLVGDVVAITCEGAGWDHVAWRIDAADGSSWIVRGASLLEPGDTDAGDAAAEVAVMRLARTVLGDLVADAVVLDASRGVIAHRRVPGVALHDLVALDAVPAAVLDRLAGEIGHFVRTLASLDPRDCAVAPRRDDDGFAPWYAELPAWRDEVASLLVRGEQAAVDRFVAAPPPPDPRPEELALAHNDLGTEHVLVDPESWQVTGIIDWSDAAVADPAAEVGRLLRDLGAGRLLTVTAGMGGGVGGGGGLVERAWTYARCLVLEDLAYARRRRPELVESELAGLRRLFVVE